MLVLLFAAALAAPVPRAALFDETPASTTVARADRRSEPVRVVVEYVAGLAAFTLVNAGGAALLSQAHVTVAHGGSVTVDGSQAALWGAGACFLFSPLAAAVTSWLIGKGSDDWDPSLGWTSVGAYGTSLVAIGAGLGLAAANLDRGAAIGANTGLYLAVPLGAVLLENATKSPHP